MKFIPQSVTRSIGQAVLSSKKNSPHIFFIGGVLGVAGSTFLACRATLKLEDTLEDIHSEIKDVKDASNVTSIAHDKHTEADQHRDVMYVYGKSVAKLGRLYGPAFLVGSVSIAALTGSHIQLTRRNTALTAAFAGISKAYEEYRARVREELGDERELDIYRGVREVEVEGEGKKKEIVKTVDPNKASPYARLFEESNVNWENSPELNKIFLMAQQNYFNHQLQARGHVFLNEIYDALGLPRSRAGLVVGWVRDGDGDGHIDFNMFSVQNSEFMNGYEPCIWLDFNVDGVVMDCLDDNEF